MASARASHDIAVLIPKLDDADADYRFMGLDDLRKIFETANPSLLVNEYNVCARVVDGLLRTLNDSNGEVQNMAIKVLSPFVNKVPEALLGPLIDKVSMLPMDNTVDNSIPALALRAIVVSLPRTVPGVPASKQAQDSYSAVSRALIPRLVGYNVFPPRERGLPPVPKSMLHTDMESGTDSNAMDVLTEVARCFGPMLRDQEIQALQGITMEVLESDRSSSVLKKKAVVAIAAISAYFSDGLLSSFISRIIDRFRNVHLTSDRRKMLIMIVGSMSRSIPRKFGPYLQTLTPFILSAVSDEELKSEMDRDVDDEADEDADDAREAALVALEGFLVSCTADMRMYTDETIDAAIRFLKYDPNLAPDDDMEDDDFDDEEALEGEDFEEEQGFDEEDDSSWKVRRCAAKLLYTVITSRAHELLADGTLYDKVAPAIVSRFKEREDSVRLEVLAALSALIRRTAEDSSIPTNLARGRTDSSSMGPPPSRKRRRGASDSSTVDSEPFFSQSAELRSPVVETPPHTKAQASLSKLTPEIINGALQLLNTSTLPTKQATIILLKDLIHARKGGVSEYLDQLVGPLVEAIKSGSSGGSGGGSSVVTTNTVMLHALQLLGAIAGAQSTASLQSQLSKIVPVLADAAKDRHGKAAAEALRTIESLILASTSKSTASEHVRPSLEEFYNTAIGRISANDADVEVRQQSILVLGMLLARTSGKPELLSSSKRVEGLRLISARLQNELLRIPTIRAIDMIVGLAQSGDDMDSKWVQDISLSLGSYLRKSNRTVRGTSLAALKKLAVNPASKDLLEAQTVSQLVQMLLPLLSADDLHLLTPALTIAATFVKRDPQTVVTQSLTTGICTVIGMTVSGAPLDALVELVRAIGEAGVGGPLMRSLLRDVGVSGNAEILGKLIGTLLVSGGSSVEVKLDDFSQELKTAADGKRRCLALAVLGESALLFGSSSSLEPRTFMSHFTSDSPQVPLSAAIGLGRAGAGNVKVYLPVILEAMKQSSSPQYLLLHSVKEILQHGEAEEEIRPFVQDLWQNLVTASKEEDNKAIAAECIGRIAILEPKSFLPQLQSFLSDRDPNTRGMVISALRYTFADTDEAYDEHLQPAVVNMLTTMLKDDDLSNLRLALTTFNSAAHNKPQLILPHINELLPLAMKETAIKPELIREVSMGPFKVKIDDGLEVRKSAYETLFSLQESAFSRLPLSELEERIIAGITDEHDIRMLCTLMLTKLIAVAPEESRRHLDDLAIAFRTVLSQKPKENAVKQELERSMEGNKAVLKVTVLINKAVIGSSGSGDAGGGTGVRGGAGEDPRLADWTGYLDWARKEHPILLKTAESELKEKER